MSVSSQDGQPCVLVLDFSDVSPDRRLNLALSPPISTWKTVFDVAEDAEMEESDSSE